MTFFHQGRGESPSGNNATAEEWEDSQVEEVTSICFYFLNTGAQFNVPFFPHSQVLNL